MSARTKEGGSGGGRKRKLSDAEAKGAVAKSAKTAEAKKAKAKVKTKTKAKQAKASGEAVPADLSRVKAKVKAKVVGDKKTKKMLKKPPLRPKQQRAPLTKKERRALKKQQKKHADLAGQLLSLWEELRVEATPAGRVSELCDQAVRLSQGKMVELAKSHDTGRILEAVLKRGGEQHRLRVFAEAKEHAVELSKSKYGKHVALKLAKYCGREQRAQLLRSFEGRAVELLKHRHAGDVLEFLYNEFANASQRGSILQEFYGPRLSVFKSPTVTGLADALASLGNDEQRQQQQHEQQQHEQHQHEQQVRSALCALRCHLLALARKGQLRHSLSHHLLLEYLQQQQQQEEEDEELLEAVRHSLVPLLHTRDGAKSALLVLRRSDGAGVKRALKAMKTFVSTAAVDEHGYLCLIGLLELLHSPELLHKFVLRELFDSVPELLASQHGRKVLLYLLSPRDSLYFSPQLLALLPKGAELQLLRQRLQSALALCSQPLLAGVAARMQQLCADRTTVLLVGEVLAKCPGDKSECCAALGQLIRQPFSPADDEQKQHIIERSASHLMLKRLLPACPQLLRHLSDTVEDADMQAWLACNRGCFFLLQLYDNCPADCQLQQRMAAALADRVRNSSLKGAQLLAARLAPLAK